MARDSTEGSTTRGAIFPLPSSAGAAGDGVPYDRVTGGKRDMNSGEDMAVSISQQFIEAPAPSTMARMT